MTKRLQYVGDSVESVKQAMNMNERFKDYVNVTIDDDKDYWVWEITKNDFIEASQVKGFDFTSKENVYVYDFEKFTKTFNNYAPAYMERYFPSDLWQRYNLGAVNNEEFFYAIRLACECIEDDFKEESAKHMLTDDEFIEHEVGSDYFEGFYIDTEKNEVVKVEQLYAENLDMTFIFRIYEDDNWSGCVKDVVNYYCGRPNEEDLNTYYE